MGIALATYSKPPSGFIAQPSKRRSWGTALERRPPRDAGALSGPLVGISFIGGAGGGVALADHPYPRPGSTPEEIRQYFGAKSVPGRLSATGQLISAASLVRFTASVARLAGRAGPQSRKLQAAAIAGGAVAAASLATSAACAAALTGRRGQQDTSAVALHSRGFIAGGPVHGAGFGALVGALSLAGLRTGELPRPLVITGLASAAAGLLSPLYLVTERAALLIPAGRVTGLIVSGIAGVRLSRGGSYP
jgi:hypothetical protein